MILLYSVYSKIISTGEEKLEMFGVRNENELFCTFTESREKAEALAAMLNLGDVDSIHVNDVIEDIFYT